MTPDPRQDYIVAIELTKAAFDNGWRIEQGERDGWKIRHSNTAPGAVALSAAGADGPWLLALDHSGVVAELGDAPADIPGPGLARFAYPTTTALHRALSRVFDLAIALPDDPLHRFEAETGDLPQQTEAERLTVQRIGQDRFRDALMRFWRERCPLTGITEPDLLRASHMKPWSECETNRQRLDVYNGLLLSALWDAAFDRKLVSFTNHGTPLWSPHLSPETRVRLDDEPCVPLTLSDQHQTYLEYHRQAFFERARA